MFRLRSKLLSGKIFSLMAAIVVATTSLTANAAALVEGQQYFTAHNFMVKKERSLTTNYWRGEMIPVNSKVTLKKLGKKKMVLDVDGRDITIINVKKHSKKSMQEVASDMLSSRKVSTRGKFQDDIQTGVLRLGMSKADVIKTRGYPPGHETPSTESNRWKYWSSRFVTRTLVFQKGRLVEGRGIN